MAQIARCDFCGKEEAMTGAFVSPPDSWWRLRQERGGSQARQFCELRCVAGWVLREVNGPKSPAPRVGGAYGGGDLG